MAMTSQSVARYIQDTTGISIARIVRKLRGLQDVTINLNGHHLAAAPRPTNAANDILTALRPHPRHTKRHESGQTQPAYGTPQPPAPP